ncbi:MAG TPA: UDP-N-acetylglucosamine 2-epimerase (non-hydrolyzing) [Saprospiraceae bacterium]|nr:UDP-N-acetylglucosamine 2-epimerase (non-hydrolyzing) [Saprospiraceae bacterium]
MHLTLIAGARPNFMKIAPIIRAIERAQAAGADIAYSLVHTGQHYDRNMSEQFFEQLGIPEPEANLGAGGGTQAEQTAAIMVGFEQYLMAHPTDLVVVVGDVTSTLACSITAKKLNIRVAHVEGGIRSGDWTMPEEINRVVTDSISDYFFTTSETANGHLRRAGVPEDRIYFVGNTMIDSLLSNMPRLRQPDIWTAAGLSEQSYFVLTLHRPANVDDPAQLKALIEAILEHSKDLPIVFPVHPRTAKNLPAEASASKRLLLTGPMGYLEFIYLVRHAKAVITDSGGITEESTVLGVPCMTLRDNTERPETIDMGTNELLGTDPAAIAPAMQRLFAGQWKKGVVPPLWDGKAAERMVRCLLEII